jgi:proline dehydrogenase
MGLVTRFAQQWVAGETMADAIRVAKEANARGLDALVNHLGEHYREKAPVESTKREYLRLLATMQSEGIRGEVSIKPTQFGVLIDRAYALSEMIPILEATKALGRVLWLDMESAHTTDDAIWIGEQLLAQYDRVGICLQANLKRTADDLDRLLEAHARVRLVKGAYQETPDTAYRTRSEIDRAYLAHLETLFTKGRNFAVASHDGRMIERALALAKEHPTPFEFAMLQGVRDPLKIELVRSGHRVAEYIPYGPNWLPYFTRRLRERPRNVITMIRSFVSG